jgi:hypothetical protein
MENGLFGRRDSRVLRVALALARLGRVDESLKMIDRACAFGAIRIPYNDLRRFAFYATFHNQPQKAVWAAEMAVLDSPSLDTLDLRAIVRALSGDTEGAIRDLAVVATGHFNHRIREQRGEWLHKIRDEEIKPDQVITEATLDSIRTLSLGQTR